MDKNFIATYDSLAEASRKTGTRDSSIRNCIIGLYHHANHYLWEYAN